MFEMAEKYYRIDKSRSWMIGDKRLDLEAGRNYGVRTALVGTGYGEQVFREWDQGQEECLWEIYGATLLDVAREIVEKE